MATFNQRNITEFRSRLAGGGARANLFEVEIAFPEELGINLIDVSDKVPREFKITKEDCRKFGYSDACPGCRSLREGRAYQPHTEACRNRFKEKLKEDARVRNREARMKEFEERERIRKERKEERKKREVKDPS